MVRKLKVIQNGDLIDKSMIGGDQVVITSDQAHPFICNVVQKESLEVIEGHVVSADPHTLLKSMYLVLKPSGSLNISIADCPPDTLQSMLKMVGFLKIQQSESIFTAQKASMINQGPPKIIRRKKEEQKQTSQPENPWASLQPTQAQELINEDDLLKKGEATQDKTVKKFCGDKDIMQGAKPCANCSCGLKEKLEGNQTTLVKDLENGNQESACGKCYLGDAFRCASCPYKGLAAFEKGDKVKLVDNQQIDIPIEAQQQVQNTQKTNGAVKLDLDMDF